jgi:hypothetical protein
MITMPDSQRTGRVIHGKAARLQTNAETAAANRYTIAAIVFLPPN